MLDIISYIAAGLLILMLILTGMQRVRKEVWWIRVSDFPHVQLTSVTLAAWVALLISGDLTTPWILIVLAIGLAGIIYQLSIIYPYTRLSKKQVADTTGTPMTSLSILEANVYMYNEDYDKLLARVKEYEPDIVIGLETDKGWTEAMQKNLSEYPYVISRPLDNTYGMILMSKYEFMDAEVRCLVEEGIPSFKVLLRLNSYTNIVLYVVHPPPPSPTEKSQSTERDAELVLVAREAKGEELPVIVAGDLNDVAWSHTTRLFQRISRLLDPRIGRGLFNTYHARHSLMRWPLDHIFHSRHFTVGRIERAGEIGSDHFPMYISLDVVNDRGKKKNGQPDKSEAPDFEEANEKIESVVNKS